MSYKIGDRVLHQTGWSAVIKSGTNETGFTIEFDGCVIPKNSEPLVGGPQHLYTMSGVLSRNLEILSEDKICSIDYTKQWRDNVDNAWQEELQKRKQEREKREQAIQKINRSTTTNSRTSKSRSSKSRSSKSRSSKSRSRNIRKGQRNEDEGW